MEYSFDGGETWQESNRKISTEDEYVEAAVKYESTGIDKICKLSIPDIGIDETTPVIEAELEENGEGNYIINAQIYDSQSGISQAKWANGAQEAEYFTENGNGFNGNNYQFTGIADEIYTIYAKDNVGNETVPVSYTHLEKFSLISWSSGGRGKANANRMKIPPYSLQTMKKGK